MRSLADWLGDADRVAELGGRLRSASVPVDRLALFRRTLHPDILGSATLWAPGGPVEIFDREHGLDLSVGFAGSPLALAMDDGVRRTLDWDALEGSAWRWADPFRGRDLGGLLLEPTGEGGVLAIGSRRSGGFTEEELDFLGRLLARMRKARPRSGRTGSAENA